MKIQNQHTGPSADLVRRRLAMMVLNLRSWISTLPNSTATVDRLRGDDGAKRAARIIDAVMKELDLKIDPRMSETSDKARRAVSGVFGASGAGEQ